MSASADADRAPEDEGRVFDFADCAPSWTAWLVAWERDIWPLFQARGVPKGAALLCWQFNEMGNRIIENGAERRKDGGAEDLPGDEWKRP